MPKPKPNALTYVGPCSSFSVFTPAKGNAKAKSDDRPLITGQTYDDLPRDHPVFFNLIAARLLVARDPASTDAAVTESDTTKKGDASEAPRSAKGGTEE